MEKLNESEKGTAEFTVHSDNQCLDNIKPRTKSQEVLINLWRKDSLKNYE